MTNDYLESWLAFRAVFFLILLCGGMALGAEPEVAEAAADGATWLPVAYAVGGGTLGGGGMWIFNKLHRVQIEPQPLEVQMKQEFVTRVEFKALTDRVDGITSSLAELKGSQKYQTELLQSINTHLIHKAL